MTGIDESRAFIPIRIAILVIFIGTAYKFIIRRSWEKWRMARIQKQLSDHLVVLGFGAAALLDDGEIITGCNVESASFGLTLCAECGLVSNLYDSGGGRILGVSIVAGDGEPALPR